MPRPTRIQYENAFYHVMNRGRGGQTIFHDASYYKSFLKTLEEASQRFEAVIHAYCLMSNHYHLLIETPRANLDRIMRHINGVYTQRHNRLKRTDGSLFRGRYKSILVDADAYLLQLSRYIHRNPVEVKGAVEEDLSSFVWSSYLAYINKIQSPDWLKRDKIYQMLGKKQKYLGYQHFVGSGVDEDIKRHYNKGNISTVLGDFSFRESLIEKKEELLSNGNLSELLSVKPDVKLILEAVAKAFNTSVDELTERKSGRQLENFPRKFAIYCCQQFGDMSLKSIAKVFNMQHEGSVSPAVAAIRKDSQMKKVRQPLKVVKKYLNVIK